MKLTVEFLSLPNLTKIVGGKRVDLDLAAGRTVNDLLAELARRYGPKLEQFLLDDEGQLDSIFKLIVNKEWLPPDEMDRELQDGDAVTIMLLVGGG